MKRFLQGKGGEQGGGTKKMKGETVYKFSGSAENYPLEFTKEQIEDRKLTLVTLKKTSVEKLKEGEQAFVQFPRGVSLIDRLDQLEKSLTSEIEQLRTSNVAQSSEIEQLRTSNVAQSSDIEQLRVSNEQLKPRVDRLEEYPFSAVVREYLNSTVGSKLVDAVNSNQKLTYPQLLNEKKYSKNSQEWKKIAKKIAKKVGSSFDLESDLPLLRELMHGCNNLAHGNVFDAEDKSRENIEKQLNELIKNVPFKMQRFVPLIEKLMK